MTKFDPAFPHIKADDHRDYAPGMSLRDYFAAQAISTIISLTQSHDGGWDEVAVAVGAYAVADAMLKTREETE